MKTKRRMALVFVVAMLAALATQGLITVAKSRMPRTEATAEKLEVSIKEWTVPTKGAHPHDPAVVRTKRCGSRSKCKTR